MTTFRTGTIGIGTLRSVESVLDDKYDIFKVKIDVQDFLIIVTPSVIRKLVQTFQISRLVLSEGK